MQKSFNILKTKDGIRFITTLVILFGIESYLAKPANDGKQTLMLGYPFIVQHVTAICCSGCIEKWHKFSFNASTK